MTDEAMSPLRRRMIEDMTIRKLAPKTQQGYIRAIKDFAAFLGRSPDTASFEDVRRFQLHLAANGAHIPIVNHTVAALRFFFRITLRRSDIIELIEPGRYRATTTKQAATSHVGARDLRLGGDPDPEQRPNLCLKHYPRPDQIDNHPTNEPAKIPHCARSSSDSRSPAKQDKVCDRDRFPAHIPTHGPVRRIG
jgi:hypothetical protein